jgi:hypothetical protein
MIDTCVNSIAKSAGARQSQRPEVFSLLHIGRKAVSNGPDCELGCWTLLGPMRFSGQGGQLNRKRTGERMIRFKAARWAALVATELGS